MPYEYLVVLFPRRRRVKINGEYLGLTNKLLELEGGGYEVALGPPANFTPMQHKVDLRNTSALTPMLIEFEEG
jgi:hypothetical protein